MLSNLWSDTGTELLPPSKFSRASRRRSRLCLTLVIAGPPLLACRRTCRDTPTITLKHSLKSEFIRFADHSQSPARSKTQQGCFPYRKSHFLLAEAGSI